MVEIWMESHVLDLDKAPESRMFCQPGRTSQILSALQRKLLDILLIFASNSP